MGIVDMDMIATLDMKKKFALRKKTSKDLQLVSTIQMM